MKMNKPYRIQFREQFEVNTDPQRRCYYGVHAKSEWHWGEWNTLYNLATWEEAEDSIDSWRRLAASSGRKLEYRILVVSKETDND